MCVFWNHLTLFDISLPSITSSVSPPLIDLLLSVIHGVKRGVRARSEPYDRSKGATRLCMLYKNSVTWLPCFWCRTANKPCGVINYYLGISLICDWSKNLAPLSLSPRLGAIIRSILWVIRDLNWLNAFKRRLKISRVRVLIGSHDCLHVFGCQLCYGFQ